MNTIVPLDTPDFEQIESLLLTSGLPIDDLHTAPIQFYGIRVDGRLIAIGALETYGDHAILRSVAIIKELQNKGIGKQLVSFLETTARKQGIQQLFLLTNTASLFFQRLDYHFTNRDSCPSKVLLSAEFAKLCPSSANCLSKLV